jgi:hypothetical protein
LLRGRPRRRSLEHLLGRRHGGGVGHTVRSTQPIDEDLGVGGNTTVDGLLWLDVSDAGFSVFRGPVSSRDRFVGARSAPRFEGGVAGRLLEEPALGTDAVLAAMTEGKSPV